MAFANRTRAGIGAGLREQPDFSAAGRSAGTMNSASTQPAARAWLKRPIGAPGARGRRALDSCRNAMNSAMVAASSAATVSSANVGLTSVLMMRANYTKGGGS